ncbi:MAG: DsbA family protein [Pseudobdellovibrionaceae bacterium]
MNKNKIFLISVVVIAVVVFGLFALLSKTEKTQEAQIVQTSIDPSLLIREHSPIKGSLDAKVTIVEFLDPECEACRAMHPIMKTLLKEYDGKVRLVIRYMPFHGNSLLAASALEEAKELGKFDEALDKLFERQPEWADHRYPKPELIAVILKEIGISEKQLDNTYLVKKHRGKVDIDEADGAKLGVRMTPTFFVNGEMLSNIGYDPVKQAIEKALAK